MEKHLRKSKLNDEYSLKLFEEYGVNNLRQLPLYTQCVTRYNNMKKVLQRKRRHNNSLGKFFSFLLRYLSFI